MPTRPISVDPNYAFPGQRRASVAPMPQAAPQAPPNPGGSDTNLSRALSGLGVSGSLSGSTNAAPNAVGAPPQKLQFGPDWLNMTGDAQGGFSLGLGPWSQDVPTPIASALGMNTLTTTAANIRDVNQDPGDQFQAGLHGSDTPGVQTAKNTLDSANAQIITAWNNQAAQAPFIDSSFERAGANYQGSLADIALTRALAGDTRDYTKEGNALDINQQRDLLTLSQQGNKRDLDILLRQRGLIDANKGFAGRELDLNKALRGIQHEEVGLNRKDIDLSDRNIELDRADIKTKYGADVRHANQASTAGGSWLSPEHEATLTDLYSNLLTNAGRLDTRWQHNNLERGRADLSDRTIDNNSGRDQLGYDKAMNSIAQELLGNESRMGAGNDALSKVAIQLGYLDPILAHRNAGADLNYRGALIPTYGQERQAGNQYADALAQFLAYVTANKNNPVSEYYGWGAGDAGG